VRAPRFWWRRPGLAAALLRPAGAIYGAIAAARAARPGARAAIPVLCAGNFVAGGAGKTPFAIALAERLRALGERPVFLSRGHGGSEAGPLLVDPARHSARDVGDEPLLLARHAPTLVSRDRPAGAALARELGSVVVMDDGLQNPSLAKDLRFALVDAVQGVGNGLCLPAGPLRAPLTAQWPLVDALVLVGEGEPGAELAREAARRHLPVIRAAIEPDEAAATALRGRAVLAFAGIGRPEKFFATARAAGARLVAERVFSDHHPYSAKELAGLRDDAARAGAALLTTEKDLVRIGRHAGASRDETPPLALPIALRIIETERLDALVQGALAGFASRAGR
jgi:tetraacyldisaccharide 4'-kinase